MPVPFRSNQIRLNRPNKVLSASVQSVEGVDYWPHAAGSDDIWYEGSNSKKFYRWRLEFTVTPQQHGSHLTRDHFEYNGFDIVVGDWIAGATDGKALKIVSVESKTRLTVTCIVEDWLRYNTFKNPTGNGMFTGGAGVVFSLNENGIPMIDPLPTNVGSIFYPTVTSRFQYLNPQLNYVLVKQNHDFEAGDVISVVKDQGFVKANSETSDRMIGVVTEPGPGPNQFMILPNNRIIDFEPGIPGEQGEYVFVTDQGTLSNVFSPASKVAFLNVQSAVPTRIEGSGENPEVVHGYTIAINSVETVFSNSNSNVGVVDMASQINANTNTHFVEATVEPVATVEVSDSTDTAYGLVGGFPPFSAYFDTGSGNTLIEFTTTGSTFTGVSTPEDMKVDIDSANIANLQVEANTTVITLRELNGNAISISNGNTDQNGYGFVGNSNVSGLAASTSATNAQKLVLERTDGGEILIYENSTLFQDQTGIFSAHTGSVPLAINIEQGIRTSGTTVVADISARDALQPAAGDQAYVVNKGDGEWGLFLYNGSDWEMISNADSATTDARTLTTSFEMPINNNDNEITKQLGNVSPGRKIAAVSVEVLDAVTGGNDAATVVVGTQAQANLLFTADSADLSESGTYFTLPEYVYPDTNTQDIVVTARVKHFDAATGNVRVRVTYV
jgi:hypothetical protein